MSLSPTVKYLLSINSVRERSKKVFQSKVLENDLTNFNVDLTKVEPMVEYVLKLIQRDYGTNYGSIPPHGRWQHFNAEGVERVEGLIKEWDGLDHLEIARRLVDLFVVSVLLDAGAGNVWKFTEPSTGMAISRSEGLAVASLYMFKQGLFSGEGKPQVDWKGLSNFTPEKLNKGMQVSEANPLEGAAGRALLLANLGKSLANKSDIIGKEGRPGGLVDYLVSKSKDSEVDLTVLWDALMAVLIPIWPPGRTKIEGTELGDAWVSSDLPETSVGSNIVTFHKLTQWLCYSIIVPIKKYSGLKIANQDLQTGLPEYRNGGLLVDFGVLQLKKNKEESAKKDSLGLPVFEVHDDVVIEWRTATVGFLDYILEKVNEKLPAGESLTLPQLLEAGTWKAGREIAAEKRPSTKGPPLVIVSDGTVF